MTIDEAAIRQLAALLQETGLDEIEIGDGERHVRVARNLATATVAAPPSPAAMTVSTPPASAAPTAAPAGPVEGAVTSPMVGTVYLAGEPGAPPFIKVGDLVAEGQTLVIVEAMKVMNPIKAPRAGRVAEIRVANGAPVEYGEILVVLG
jgi:acetyl-CoA carboxylase biotin carboxyl carrier protein